MERDRELWSRIKAHPILSGTVGSLLAAAIWAVGSNLSKLWSLTLLLVTNRWFLGGLAVMLVFSSGIAATLILQRARRPVAEDSLPDPTVLPLSGGQFEYPHRESSPRGAVFRLKYHSLGIYEGMPEEYLRAQGITRDPYIDTPPHCPNCRAQVAEAKKPGRSDEWIWRCHRADCGWTADSPVSFTGAASIVSGVAGIR